MKTISRKYILLVLSLYITEFTGFSFFTEGFVSILRKQGVGLQYLGLIYMLGLFIVFRFLWASYIDKIKFSKYGHYKGWLFLTNILIIFTIIAISLCTIENSLLFIIICITFFSLIASTQYIALDGFIYKTLSKNQRAVGNALKMAGGMIGSILGSGVGLIMYTNIGWQNTFLTFIILPIFCMVLLLNFNEKETIKGEISQSIRLRDIFRYWLPKEKRIWLYLIISSPIPIAIFFGLTSRILVDNHWALDKTGFIVNIVGYSIGALVSFFVPLIILKFGKKNVLCIGLLGQILGLMLLIFVLNGNTSTKFVGVMVALTYMFYPLMSTVIATLMMDNIKSNTPAFEYSIQHSLNMFILLLSTGMSMFLAGFIGYENVIYIGIILGLTALIPAWKMKMS